MKTFLPILAAAALLTGCATDRLASRQMVAAPGRSFRGCLGCPVMVVVPAGQFVMGSPAGEPRRDPDEGPQKIIRFDRPFAIARYPVTRREFARFARSTRHAPGDSCYAERDHSGRWAVEQGLTWQKAGYPQTARDPVVCVNFDDIRAYIAWLNGRTGGGYRLISQAEYEYGARAGLAAPFPTGGSMTHDQANFGDDPCCHGKVEGRDRWRYTSPVGSFALNAFGLGDMLGNVWEFTSDCYDDTLASVPDTGGPALTAACEKRVIRGAGWDDPPYYLRSANRYKQLETLRGSVTGFRLAKAL